MEKYYLNEDDYDEGVPSITSYYGGEYPNVVDRYFTRFYCKKTSSDGSENEDQLVLFHSNRLCLIALAKSHVALSKGVASVSYNIGNSDRSLNHVQGKHKKGGMNLQPSTIIANVTCVDGSEYKVASCVTGKLIEVNRFGTSFDKLAVEGAGYIAVVLCKPEHCDDIKSSLVTEADYAP